MDEAPPWPDRRERPPTPPDRPTPTARQPDLLIPGARFHRREVTIAAGVRMEFVDADWHGALILVERGDIDLCCSRGGSRRFVTGAVLFFDGLDLVALRNPGLVDTVLVAMSRRT